MEIDDFWGIFEGNVVWFFDVEDFFVWLSCLLLFVLFFFYG